MRTRAPYFRTYQRISSAAMRTPATTPITSVTPVSARAGVASSRPRAVSLTGSSMPPSYPLAAGLSLVQRDVEARVSQAGEQAQPEDEVLLHRTSAGDVAEADAPLRGPAEAGKQLDDLRLRSVVVARHEQHVVS